MLKVDNKRLSFISIDNKNFELAKQIMDNLQFSYQVTEKQDSKVIIRLNTRPTFKLLKEKILKNIDFQIVTTGPQYNAIQVQNSRVENPNKKKEFLKKKFYLSGMSDLISTLEEIKEYNDGDINFLILKYEMEIRTFEEKMKEKLAKMKQELSNLYKMKAHLNKNNNNNNVH